MKTYKIDMTEGSILKKLIAFSVPLVCSSVLQLFFNAADVIVVGRFAGNTSLAAVDSTTSLINLLVNFFMGLSIGTNVIAANFFGAKKQKDLQDTIHTSILLSFISGIILTLIGVFGAKHILRLMHAPEEVLSLATQYLRIYFSGIIATMIYNFGSALLRAKGDTQRPLYILLLAGIINVLLNLLFVIVFSLNVIGVALATVLSQSFAAFCILVILTKEKDDFHLDWFKLKINNVILLKILKIGLPTGFQGMMFSFSNVIIQSSINTFGSLVIAGNAAGGSIECFVYNAMNGFSQGTLTFTSQNFGAKKPERIKKVVFISHAIVFLIGLCLGNLVVFFSRDLLRIYSDNEEIIQAGMLRLKVICSTYAICGMMDCMGNTVRGMGNSLLPMIVTLLGACIFRILWLATVFQIPQFHTCLTIFFSYPISWFITWIVHIICFIITFSNTYKVKPIEN